MNPISTLGIVVAVTFSLGSVTSAEFSYFSKNHEQSSTNSVMTDNKKAPPILIAGGGKQVPPMLIAGGGKQVPPMLIAGGAKQVPPMLIATGSKQVPPSYLA